MPQIQFQIKGMTCQACANRIEKVLNKKDFVQAASVNFASETAQIQFDDTQTSPEQLIQIIEKTGFQAALPTSSTLPENPTPHSTWRVWALLALTAPFMLGMVGMMFGSHALMPPVWVQIVLATVAQTYFALPFYRGAWASLRAGSANMDVLVALGTSAIFVYSLAMSANGVHHVYFEAGVMVLAFVSLGKYWEAKTKRGSLNALGALLQLTPKEVLVYKNKNWQTVPLNQIQKGDVLRGVHGTRVAADGEVVAGEAWADESHLTGESQPVHKTIGNKVLAGSVLSGSVDYRAESLGADTLLGDMAAALAQAQGSKAPMARLADKVAAVFVPVVVVVALLAFVLNFIVLGDFQAALMRGVAVLVVACPCALGLATPAAMMAGMGVAVQRGVWFKDAAALESAGAVQAVVLDKTGTLTQGKPEVVGIWCAENVSEKQLFELTIAVERHSAHPLAQAIVQAASKTEKMLDFELENVNTVAGEGMVAQIKSQGEIRIGTPEFCGFRLPETLLSQNHWANSSIVAVSLNHQALGAFALADTLKNDSCAAVQKLRQHHEVYIVSGDNSATVHHIAQQIGLPEHNAHGNCQPRQKVEFIQQLKQKNQTTAMVGDGINDAPALALADVGFAVRGSTDIAEHSANAVLVRPSVAALADGLHIARQTVGVMKQNLFFALIYNVLGIPLAAMGYLTPVLAGAMMALSSVSVLGNALRLKRMK